MLQVPVQVDPGLTSGTSPAEVTSTRKGAKDDKDGVGGSSGEETDGTTDDGDDDSQWDECGGALWELAKRMPDLQMLTTVQQMTTLDFLKPFGRRSRRHFTLFAPTDSAFFLAFSECQGSAPAGEAIAASHTTLHSPPAIISSTPPHPPLPTVQATTLFCR
jgi:hypothetical protein